MDALKQSDADAAAVQKTPNRVTLAYMESLIVGEFYINGAAAVGLSELRPGATQEPFANLACLTICILQTRNGFTLVGQSAPADVANFNAELGRKFARQDALGKLWPLEGYMLRQRLHEAHCVAMAGDMDGPSDEQI